MQAFEHGTVTDRKLGVLQTRFYSAIQRPVKWANQANQIVQPLWGTHGIDDINNVIMTSALSSHATLAGVQSPEMIEVRGIPTEEVSKMALALSASWLTTPQQTQERRLELPMMERTS